MGSSPLTLESNRMKTLPTFALLIFVVGFIQGNEIQDVSQILLDINVITEESIKENNGFLSNLKGMVWKRSTDKDALAQLDEIHDALEPIFDKTCLAPSDY